MFHPRPIAELLSANKQDGAALLILLALVTLAIASFLLTGINRIQNGLDSSSHNRAVLAEAKSALIAYSRLSDPDLSASTGLNLRYLPCPDINGDGLEESPCGASSAEGWLPWLTLGLPPLRDASSSCLRYFVSSSYKQGSSVVPSITPSLPAGDYTFRDVSRVLSTGVIAVIIAPGEVLDGQVRTYSISSATECGSNITSNAVNLAVNYMDTIHGVDNALAPVFVTSPRQVEETINFNDNLSIVIPNDLL